MKKYFEVRPSFDDLKEKVVVLQDREDKKTLFVVITAVVAVLALVTVGVIYLLKNKMNDEYDEEWDYDWDDLDDECFDEFDESVDCCCNDADVDQTVKVEPVEK